MVTCPTRAPILVCTQQQAGLVLLKHLTVTRSKIDNMNCGECLAFGVNESLDIALCCGEVGLSFFLSRRYSQFLFF